MGQTNAIVPESADRAAIDRAVGELKQVEQETGWARVIKIVEVVQRHLAGGHPEAPGCVNGIERRSIRALAAHPECPLNRTQLTDMLAAHRVFCQHPNVRHSRRITPSHAALVAKLPPEHQCALLEQAHELSLSVRELRAKVRTPPTATGKRRGRPPSSLISKVLTRIANLDVAFHEIESLLEGASESDGQNFRSVKTGLVKVARRANALAARASSRDGSLSRAATPAKSGKPERLTRCRDRLTSHLFVGV